jgi:chromosome segregation ATPase
MVVAEMLEEFLNPPNDVVAEVWERPEAKKMSTEAIRAQARGIVAGRIADHIGGLESRLAASEAARVAAEQERVVLGEMFTDVSQQLKMAEVGTDALTAQLAEARKDVEILRRSNYALEDRVLSVGKDLAAAKNELAEARAELETATRSRDGWKADAEREMGNVEFWKAQLAAATQRAERTINAALTITGQVECGDVRGTGPWLEIQNVLRSYAEGPPHAQS